MQTTFQSEGQSIYQHGESVHDYFADLYEHLRNGTPLRHEWRLPAWINDPRLIQGCMPFETLKQYQIFHDCGKPFCRTVDDQGRQHFPDHANISADMWLAAGGDSETADLIRMDMDIHMLKADQIAEFAARPQAMSLILTGLAELHSNARMFGGIESTSFKIKWKNLDKRGRQILEQCARMAP